MPVVLSQNCYGKSSVRVAKVVRHPDRHELKEVAVDIQLTGYFESVYRAGDNSPVLPTDTMKNTVYALAKEHALLTIEDFGLSLARYFLDNNPQISSARIELAEKLWQRILTSSTAQAAAPHPHAFTSAGSEQWTSVITPDRTSTSIRSGLKDLLLLKTKDSGFSGFPRDKFTTLKETDDRIFATDLQTSWLYRGENIDFARCRQALRQTLLETFARHRSLSVQHTLYAMGEAALENCREVEEIHLVMPNKHYLPFDLERFGMENHNEIFVPTDEPFGRIEGTIKRV